MNVKVLTSEDEACSNGIIPAVEGSQIWPKEISLQLSWVNLQSRREDCASIVKDDSFGPLSLPNQTLLDLFDVQVAHY